MEQGKEITGIPGARGIHSLTHRSLKALHGSKKVGYVSHLYGDERTAPRDGDLQAESPVDFDCCG
ncbi:hypothetical protein PM082_006319 [Marasmius tenuissimus]|nr:hypothetical protein PM082_006319 [Marasmius tenuissimus]